ncbi:MAG: hypothetical protein EOP19_29140, partial [Hyphomicrobiales bacterium]
MFIKKFLHLYLEPAGDDGSVIDRGDDFVPTGDDADDAAVEKVEKVDPKLAADPGGDPDATDEEKAAAAAVIADAEAAKTKKGGAIPLDRHEKVLAREREQRATVERELAQYKQGAAVAETNADITKAEDSIVALEAKY